MQRGKKAPRRGGRRVVAVQQPMRFLDNGGRPVAEWKKWVRVFQNYLVASGLSRECEEQKIALLLNNVGAEALWFVSNLSERPKTVEQAIEVLSSKFMPKETLCLKRHKFFSCVQRRIEEVCGYMDRLSSLIKECEFSELEDDLVCSQFVRGLKDQKILKRLLAEEKLSSKKAL